MLAALNSKRLKTWPATDQEIFHLNSTLSLENNEHTENGFKFNFFFFFVSKYANLKIVHVYIVLFDVSRFCHNRKFRLLKQTHLNCCESKRQMHSISTTFIEIFFRELVFFHYRNLILLTNFSFPQNLSKFFFSKFSKSSQSKIEKDNDTHNIHTNTF